VSRVSRAEAQANRARVVGAAARLVREHGAAGVSVAEVMKAVGLTPGGFYKQFASKEALVDEATAQGFADMMSRLEAASADHPDHATARAAVEDAYLSAAHRDDPGDGCPAAGFAPDATQEPSLRPTYAAGVRAMAGWLAPGDEGLADLSTLVGAIVLARATAGDPLSDDILRAARNALT
jgi:TetR/AcrR family transcriptional regulator, transcriptional repressor for nem operon